MSQEPHIADAEKRYLVINVPPDFCVVGGEVVPFDIVRELKMEKADYATSVFSRSEAVLMVESITKGIKGNAGRGVISGVSKGEGHVKVLKGSSTVFVENRAAARHNDLCLMNGQMEAPPAREEDFRGVED